jgi:integrase
MMHLHSNPEASMASHPTPVKLKPHHGYQSWTSDWYDDLGKRRTKRFGKEGELSASVAKAMYRTWLRTEWETKPHVRNPDGDGKAMTVAQLAQAYHDHAETVYRKNGRLTSTMGQVKAAMTALGEAFGTLPASSLDAPRVARLRDAMIWKTVGQGADARRVNLSVRTINGRLQTIKQAYAWAREKGMVEAVAAYDVSLVKPLRKGRTEAKGPAKVRPVDPAVVKATAANAPPTLAAMIQVQGLTGMRPGEVCQMRPCDIDRSRKVWVYTPATHKTEHHDHDRKVTIGPRAQRLLIPFLGRDPGAYLFSPAEAQAWRREQRTKARKTPPNEGNRAGACRVRRPQRKPGGRYDTTAYRRAIHWACVKAGVGKWHPHQLRHSWATEVRRRFGLEEASVGMGNSIQVAELYAERDLAKAMEVARKVG